MPSWLRNQLTRAFFDKDKRSIVMLNRVFYKYRRNLRQERADSELE
ncbi:MAG TPA: cortex morphogenetic protein CmpA [Bacilli bacterium]|nr:cortex morphogenetic protein CmpA [Bacilli bacterium]